MMKLMWTADLKLNTVHVIDLCRAITFLANKKEAVGQIYNVVDKGETNQGKITDIVSNIFDINHDYWGTAISSVAKVKEKQCVEFSDMLIFRYCFRLIWRRLLKK